MININQQPVQNGAMFSFGSYHLILTLKRNEDSSDNESLAVLLADGDETKQLQ